MCHACSWAGPADTRQACPVCGATLIARRAGAGAGGAAVGGATAGGTATASAGAPGWDPTASGIWRYRSWLPVPPTAEPVTLGEGATPLLPAPRLAPGTRLLLKNDTANPTLAFKDRPVSVAATVARALGQRGLLAASTGNTAASVAAYAARAGLPAVCLVPAGTSAGKLALVTGAGARLLEVDGTFSDAHALAGELAAAAGWANLTTTYANPYMVEGDKTLALELFEQLGDDVPEAVLVPVGAGPLLGGIGAGFDELRAAGLTDRVPRLFAVQAAGCAPIARAFAEDAPVRAWEAPSGAAKGAGGTMTQAGAIADPLAGYVADGERTLAAVRASGGSALAVDDDELAAAARDLAHAEGLSVELAAAGGVAAHRRLLESGALAPDDRAVAVLTGHASKEPPRGGDAASAALGTVAAGDVETAQALLGALDA